MKMAIVSLRDRKVEAFGRPVFVHTEAAAIRSLGDEVNGGGGEDLAKHPEDFDLYAIGVFDDESGIITAYEIPRHICAASDLKP